MHTTAHEVRDEQLHGYDVCIVGAGAAGLCLAERLLRDGLRVLVLEAGSWSDNPKLNDAYVGSADAPHPPTTEYRRQRIGGTTHLWGGRCVPFDPIDLEQRDHVPNSGWPMAHHELAKHYPQAMDWCDAGAADFSVRSLTDSTPMFKGLELLQGTVNEHIERYSLPTDFGRKFRRLIKSHPSLLVLSNARVIELQPAENGQRLTQIHARCNRTQRVLTIQAAHYVLAAGGIETTRLLLAMRRAYPHVCPQLDASLGRYYSCHFDAIVGQMQFSEAAPRFFFERSRDGVYCRRKLQLSANVQRQHQLLNAAFRLHFPAYADPAHRSGVLSSIYLAKSVLPKEHQAILNHGRFNRGSIPHHLMNVVTDLPGVARFSAQWLFGMKLARRKLPYTLVAPKSGLYPLEFNSEQVPSEDNRIELRPNRDQHALARVHVRWKLHDADIDSALRSFKLLQHHLNQSTSARLLLPDDDTLRLQLASALPVGGHHMGTTRMGADAKSSVVNPQLRVHGMGNLHVCASSVMPTCSHANPTMALLALTSMLGARLSMLAQQHHSVHQVIPLQANA